jgi:hypothetical protein
MIGKRKGGLCLCGHSAGKHDSHGRCTDTDCEDCEGYCCQDCERAECECFTK